jgi:uncharacterized protein YjbI with pentapeptide repeats
MTEIILPILDIPLRRVPDSGWPEFLAGIQRTEAVNDTRLDRVTRPEAELTQLDWKQCSVESGRLTGAKLGDSYFSNVLFSGCDLSGADFGGGVFSKVHFRDCKLTGALFGDCGLNDTLFTGCVCDYTVFSYSKAKRLWFQGCRLYEAQLAELSGKDYGFAECDLTRGNFQRTALSGVNLSTCELEGILISPAELRGAKVSAVQAVELAKLMGLVVV